MLSRKDARMHGVLEEAQREDVLGVLAMRRGYRAKGSTPEDGDEHTHGSF